MSSADARLPSAKIAFMISRSRHVSRSMVILGIVMVSHQYVICDTCHITCATGVACQDPYRIGWVLYGAIAYVRPMVDNLPSWRSG